MTLHLTWPVTSSMTSKTKICTLFRKFKSGPIKYRFRIENWPSSLVDTKGGGGETPHPHRWGGSGNTPSGRGLTRAALGLPAERPTGWRGEMILPLSLLTHEPSGQWRCPRKGVKFYPVTDPGGPFAIQTIKYCNLSLPTFHENERFTCCGESISGVKGPIVGIRWPIPCSRGPIQG